MDPYLKFANSKNIIPNTGTTADLLLACFWLESCALAALLADSWEPAYCD